MAFVLASSAVLAGLGYAELALHWNVAILAWIMAFGGNVGSFMNVVIFRLPAGTSIVHPRSRCPRCHSLIRWFDNIPILSWVLLKARCRGCGTAISARYPAIEALVAASFVLLAALEPMSSGSNLPNTFQMPLRLYSMGALWGIYAFHMLLICTLICASMIRYDGHDPSIRLTMPAWSVGLTLPLVFPILRPLPFQVPSQLHRHLVALLDSGCGAGVGLALGAVALFSWGRFRARSSPGELGAASLVGLYLGWQGAVGVICSTMLAYFVSQVVGLRWRPARRVPWLGCLTAILMLWIALWKPLAEVAPWLGAESSAATFGIAAILVGILGCLTGCCLQSKSTSGSDRDSEPSESEPVRGTTTEGTPQLQAILNSPSFRRVIDDVEFLQRDELRPVRLQLELLKPELSFIKHRVGSTIVAFGGARIVEQSKATEGRDRIRDELATAPDDPRLLRRLERAESLLAKSKYYDAARDFGRLASSACLDREVCEFVIMTGGGPGVMEAANRGAHDVGAKSIGLKINLPAEETPNPYISPELCFQFDYFAIRKMHFLLRARALVVFPGGFGTLDELFDALTLRQTNRMPEIPIVLFGQDYWDRVIDFQFLADEGVISDEHLELFQFAETPEQAWQIVTEFYEHRSRQV